MIDHLDLYPGGRFVKASPPEPSGSLWYVKHDLVARGAGSGMPETCRCMIGDETPVTNQLRDLIISVHMVLHPELSEADVVAELKKLFRTNGGWNNGKSNGWDGDFKLDDLHSGGWTARAVNVVDGFPVLVTAGKVFQDPTGKKIDGSNQYFEVECMNIAHLDPYPNKPSDINMLHWFFPTTATTGRSNPFPNMGGRCLVPFVRRRDTNWIKWVNANVVGGMRAVEPVSHIVQPHQPERPDVTSGLI